MRAEISSFGHRFVKIIKHKLILVYKHLQRFTGESCEIEAGERALNFSFVIPHQIPSSYSDDIGKIKYVAKAKVDIPWATDIESEKEFYVRDYLTLNQLPSANVRIHQYLNNHINIISFKLFIFQEVIKRENSKHLCCCCCESGPITCRCWLPKQFYLPHEQISFSAEIENLSNQRMRGSYLKMIQVKLIQYMSVYVSILMVFG